MTLKLIYGALKGRCPYKIKTKMSFQVFPPRDELSKTSSGLLEFQSIHEAVVALIQLNHRKLLLRNTLQK